MKILDSKRCNCCGKMHHTLPAQAVFGDEEKGQYPGAFFDCECGSSLYIPLNRLEKSQISELGLQKQTLMTAVQLNLITRKEFVRTWIGLYPDLARDLLGMGFSFYD